MQVTWNVVGGRLVAKDGSGKELGAWEDPDGLAAGVAAAFGSRPELGRFALGFGPESPVIAPKPHPAPAGG